MKDLKRRLITYELAAELKRAGFPQQPSPPLYISKEGVIAIDVGDSKDWCYIPTLDELMDAFGFGWPYLQMPQQGLYDEDRFRWFVSLKSGDPTGEGKTPKEALSRAYIAVDNAQEFKRRKP